MENFNFTPIFDLILLKLWTIEPVHTLLVLLVRFSEVMLKRKSPILKNDKNWSDLILFLSYFSFFI